MISRRPRPMLCALLAPSLLAALLLAAACSLVKPAEPAGDKQRQAQRLAAEGKHADAAREYAQLAAATPAEHDNYELLSAEQWVIAGNVPAAKDALAAAPEALVAGALTVGAGSAVLF